MIVPSSDGGVKIPSFRRPATSAWQAARLVLSGAKRSFGSQRCGLSAGRVEKGWVGLASSPGTVLFGIPNALIVWAFIGAGAVFVLNRTTFGRAVYAIGNRERAAYLSGIGTQRVVMIAFAIAGGLSAFGGILLAGYSSKAAQAMGDPYLLPSIAAVVLGGTSILGGRGSYIGTVAGVILITLLQSILSVMQMEEFGRQVIYGLVIIVMLLIYGREKLVR